MVRVRIDHTAQACQDLTAQVRRRQNEIDVVEGVLATLPSLSGMDDVIVRLRKETVNLRSEQCGLLDMLQALNRIQEIYAAAEKRVCDVAEGNIVKHTYPEIEYVKLPDVKNGLIKNNEMG